MSSSTASSRSRPSRPPLWLVEGLDIVQHRRRLLLVVVAVVVALGVLLAVVAPGIVPPVPVVGAAVGLAAVLLGLAAILAADTADLTVRGPRHVGAAGGELVAVLPHDPDPSAAARLADAVSEAKEEGEPLLLGLAASGSDTRRTSGWTDALARALSDSGLRVLRIDLASGDGEGPGLVEVVRGELKLAQAVEFEAGLRLTRLGPGGDRAGALEALAELTTRLPPDLDVLLAALPTAATRQVVQAVACLDHVLIVAERDRTSRVELIAGLDALEAAGTHPQVVLLDEHTAARLGEREPASDTTAAAAELLASVPASTTVRPVPPRVTLLPADPSASLAPTQPGLSDPDPVLPTPDPDPDPVAPDPDPGPLAPEPDRAAVPPEPDPLPVPPEPGPLPVPPEPGPGPIVPEPDPLPVPPEPGPLPVPPEPGPGPIVPEPDPLPAPPEPAPGSDAAAAPRPVDVLLGAAAASATAQIAADLRHAETDEAPHQDDAAAQEPTEADATDEILPVGGGPALQPRDPVQDDLLRTTAQLALLMEDLEGRVETPVETPGERPVEGRVDRAPHAGPS
jgi:hypothetical protein